MARLGQYSLRNRFNEKSFPSESRICILSPLPGNVTTRLEGASTEPKSVGRATNADAIPILISSNIVEMNSSNRPTRVRVGGTSHAQATKLKGWTRSGQLRKNYISTKNQIKKKKRKRKRKRKKL